MPGGAEQRGIDLAEGAFPETGADSVRAYAGAGGEARDPAVAAVWRSCRSCVLIGV